MTEIELQKRMSESLLWKLQTTAYMQYGIEAWTQKGVPSYITSNPYTAKQYAHVVLSYLRDCLNPHAATPINIDEPINILDLGAGTGRFSYLFLKQFLPLLQRVYKGKLRIRYIMTDIVEENIAFWQKHPYFQAYISEGILDFAHYHHADQEPSLHLIHSKQILSKGTIKNPLILLANYFFDTIPQDLFRVKDGQLEEGRVTLSTPTHDEVHVDDPTLIKDLQLAYDYHPVDDPETYYKGYPQFNAILELYRQKFDNIPFLFPIGALQSLKFFSELSGGRFLLIAGDQGVVTEDQVKTWGEPKIDKHGTFSVSVSYHALAHYFMELNGAGLLTRFPDPLFVVMAGILGGKLERYPETHVAFSEHLDAYEPKDYWRLASCVEKSKELPSLDCLLSVIKLGNWDPINFHAFYPMILKRIETATGNQKEQLTQAIHCAWEQFFPIDKGEGDFVMNLGVLLYEMKRYSDALLFFQRAVEIGGEKPQVLNNMGACYLALQDSQSALKCFQKAKS